MKHKGKKAYYIIALEMTISSWIGYLHLQNKQKTLAYFGEVSAAWLYLEFIL